MNDLPPLFLERLRKIIPEESFESAEESFSKERPLSVRVNTLKISKDDALSMLRQKNIEYKPVVWYENALILCKKRGQADVSACPLLTLREFHETKLMDEGYFYIQNLSSMLPVLALDIKPGEEILDMCAAPGSKTVQMAAHLNNSGTITALETVKDRFYRLKSVVTQFGAKNISCKFTDARKFRSSQLFDKILVDAPCSSEGRFKTGDKKSYAYWSPRKIKEMMHKQRGLLVSAGRLLKPDGILVYSTCTFSPEENEGVVSWFLKKTNDTMVLEEISLPDVPRYSSLLEWENKSFHADVKKCFRVLPGDNMEGFFIAKFKKNY